MFEHAPYSVVTVLCTSGGNWGKLVSPLLLQVTVTAAVPVQVHSGGQDCAVDVCKRAVDVCKPASSTSSTGRVTDQPYPAGDTGGQDTSHYVLTCTHYGVNIALFPGPAQVLSLTFVRTWESLGTRVVTLGVCMSDLLKPYKCKH